VNESIAEKLINAGLNGTGRQSNNKTKATDASCTVRVRCSLRLVLVLLLLVYSPTLDDNNSNDNNNDNSNDNDNQVLNSSGAVVRTGFAPKDWTRGHWPLATTKVQRESCRVHVLLFVRSLAPMLPLDQSNPIQSNPINQSINQSINQTN